VDTTSVLTGYIACALWIEMDESEPNGGHPLDRNFSGADITDDATATMRTEVDAFLAGLPAHSRDGLELVMADEEVGHNLWLTRNGHGTGFWDRGLGTLGDDLANAAHALGECHLYVGDDQSLHYFSG
jgi:hypothetical protein